MRTLKHLIAGIAGAAASIGFAASAANAQSLSIALRGTGSFPTGDFAQASSSASASANGALIEGAKSGFGYGLDVGIGFGPIGAYAGFDHVKFDCNTGTCNSNGNYTLEGVSAGLKLYMPSVSMLRPFIRGGATFNDLQGSYGGQTANGLSTDHTPGYELGLGADIGLPSFGLVSLSPELRYIGQNLKAKIPGVTVSSTATPNQGVNYFRFDLGLSVHTPFGK